MKTPILFLMLMLLVGNASFGQSKKVSARDEQQIDLLVKSLTLEEKVDLLGGTGFATKPIKRLGIPSIKMTDGPVGVRWDKSTAYPVSAAMAATWDTAMVRRIGIAIANDTKAHGRDMILGPCVNINRVPQGGRNFESFSEDPWLASRMAVAYVTGVQSRHVITSTKHYACNNQEYERDFIDTRVDERTLHEIYLPAFKAAVEEADTWTIMAAYNKINGWHATENQYLQNDVLKGLWNFQGFIVSDWGATHSTVNAANHGLDLEMPNGKFFDAKLIAAVKEDSVKESVIDDKVRRLLRVMMKAGLFAKQTSAVAVNEKEQRATALAAAQAAMVLLKNDGETLPLNAKKIRTLAVIGPNADIARPGGGGSSQVNPSITVSPRAALEKRLGASRIRFAKGMRMEGDISVIESSALIPADGKPGEHGLKGEYFNNMKLEGAPALTRTDAKLDFIWNESPAPGINADQFSVRWTGKLKPAASGRYTLQTASDDGVRLFVDGKKMIDDWTNHAMLTNTCSIDLDSTKEYDIRIEFYEDGGGAGMQFGWTKPGANLIDEAVAAARNADAAVVVVGTSPAIETEGADRKSIELPDGQAELIAAIANVNKNTIVVMQNGAPIVMTGWNNTVPAILEAWFGGQECGTAIADILFGDVNPSGKLPATFPKSWQDCPAFGNYPGPGGSVNYAEGIYVGYRHFDTKKIDPLYPFGHGLSYTTFAYGPCAIAPVKARTNAVVTVSTDISNTGARAGSEVVQLYIRPVHPSVDRPMKELKRFVKVALRPGEKKRVTMTLDPSAFAYYDSGTHAWKTEPGNYELLIGSSSRDIRSTGTVTLE
ncbi:MAG TPA: glycoside hydrolase family 3 C-terminal domain-containing protein [Bacteroidota bacterium]|nr:glycoside hydrolase family 3 C-terminal domain-containing protein [Bacteroidota bacterium]